MVLNGQSHTSPALTPGEKSPPPQYALIRCRVHVLEKGKSLTPTGIRTPDRPARSLVAILGYYLIYTGTECFLSVWMCVLFNDAIWENPVPVPLCPPQIPHGITWDWTKASAVRGRRLTAWASHAYAPVCLRKVAVNWDPRKWQKCVCSWRSPGGRVGLHARDGNITGEM
jgi:hypothetical protein